MLATVDDMTAERVARDVRDFGHGYIRVDRDGRAEHVPADAVLVVGDPRAVDRWADDGGRA
jgi:hypothetical protein